jgi:thiamine biosynthesis lipoprotein
MFGIPRAASGRQSIPKKATRPGVDDGWHKREEAIMGTAITVELWSASRSDGEAAIDAVMQEMHRINCLMSPHKPESELSQINAGAALAPVAVCAELFGLLSRAAYFSELSGGAFDITFAAIGRLFDYRQGVRPTVAQLEQARLAVGYQSLLLDADAQTVQFLKPNMCIDLGGFAKGHAVDNATRILRALGIQHANVSAGGDSRVIGDKRGRPWMIGVRDPRQVDGIIALLPLENTSISTSGDYERFFIADGIRFHHLINPFTGESPDSVRSVTILAEDGLTTEAFSKIVFVLGIEQGLRLVDAYPEVDAIVIDMAGQLHYSSGLLQPNV